MVKKRVRLNQRELTFIAALIPNLGRIDLFVDHIRDAIVCLCLFVPLFAHAVILSALFSILWRVYLNSRAQVQRLEWLFAGWSPTRPMDILWHGRTISALMHDDSTHNPTVSNQLTKK